MRSLAITKDAVDFWSRLDAKQFRQVGRKVLAVLADPIAPDSRPLVGMDYLRVDIGEYRIIYRFDAQNVYVYRIGKRNDDEVYR
jgi:mRNA interferase RelE/StbE